MEGYESEKEQVEKIRKWWSENGSSIIAGLVIGFALLAGWRYWQHQTQVASAQASANYDVMRNYINANDIKAAVEEADVIVTDYPKSTYATLAQLTAAQLLVEQGDLTAASDRLQSVLDENDNENFRHIARIRLGRLLLAEGKGSEALKLIEGVDTGEYLAAYAELRGDILMAQGDAAKAGNSYRQAIAALSEEHGAYRQLLDMKLGNLGLPTEEGK